MENSKASEERSNSKPGKPDIQEIKKIFKQSKNDPSVKDALKKEIQPVNPGDLSSIHNTSETGTSGGDQRASETEINNANEPTSP